MSLKDAKLKITKQFGAGALIRVGDSDLCDLYLLRNKVNGKVYVGKTTAGTDRRLAQHRSLARKGRGYYLHAAIRKYGIEKFDVTHLGSWLTPEKVNAMESLCIDIFRSHDRDYGYNCTLGGEGQKCSEETRRKLSWAATGRKLDEATKHKIRLVHLGKKETPDVRQRLSESRKGIKHPRHSSSMREVWNRPGFRENMSHKIKLSWANPEIRARRVKKAAVA